MNILVIGGMHGNEPLGPKLVAALNQNPIAGITTLLANPRAIAANARSLDQDLNRSFPGDSRSTLYEVHRAAEIMQQIQGYDLILDFHNTLCPDNDCAFLGATAGQLLLQVATFLGLNRVITAEYNCINKYMPNCLSIEISVTSPRMNLSGWIRLLNQLARSTDLPVPSAIERFRYVRTLTNTDRDTFKLDQTGLQVFRPMPETVTSLLGLNHPTYPIFLGQNYTGQVYAGLLEPLLPE